MPERKAHYGDAEPRFYATKLDSKRRKARRRCGYEVALVYILGVSE